MSSRIFRIEVDVFGQPAYPGTAQVIFPFAPMSILIVNDDTADDVFASFDGAADHVHLLGSGSVTFTFQRGLELFLRRGALGVTPTNVQVIAEQ